MSKAIGSSFHSFAFAALLAATIIIGCGKDSITRQQPDYRTFGTCTKGELVTGVNPETGTVQCAPDSDTTVSAGDGLTLKGGRLSVDDTVARAEHGHDDLTGELAALRAELEAADYCPRLVGYDGVRRAYTPDLGIPGIVRCTFGSDEMVKVGDFWVDRYEASICPGSGEIESEQGNDTTAAACSVAGALPTTTVTWFQSAQMCANAGKRLCGNAEWQTAAAGTPDPGATTTDEECNVSSDGTPAAAGTHTDCVSRFGAYDMAGNIWEWVADWHGKSSSVSALTSNATYGNDWMFDVSPADDQGGGLNFPAAVLRGGDWGAGTGAGAFAMYLGFAPSSMLSTIGARCCAGGR